MLFFSLSYNLLFILWKQFISNYLFPASSVRDLRNSVENQIASLWDLDSELSRAFTAELGATLKGKVNLLTRESGALKTSFNYLLLDPRISNNLPMRAWNLQEEVFSAF